MLDDSAKDKVYGNCPRKSKIVCNKDDSDEIALSGRELFVPELSGSVTGLYFLKLLLCQFTD